VVRDNEVYMHAARSMTRLGHLEPAAAEVLAAFHAFFFCKEIGLQKSLWKMMHSKLLKQ
jgi:hypothetical protein